MEIRENPVSYSGSFVYLPKNYSVATIAGWLKGKLLRVTVS